MPAHLRKRRGFWYLIDGRVRTSLKTDVKRLAEARLTQYINGRFNLNPSVTIREYYEQWMDTKKAVSRKSALRDYSQHFRRYILPEFGSRSMDILTIDQLSTFQHKLLTFLAIKTTRNIIDGSFRSLWRSARREGRVSQNPFELLEWPAAARLLPEPFTVDEMAALLAWFKLAEPFYYPFVIWQFETGARPSESSALRFADVQWNRVRIHRSRHLKTEAATKTKNSQRIITIGPTLAAVLAEQRLPFFTDDDHLFYNKHGGALDANQWAKDYWRAAQEKLGIAHRRKFYATRHTFITEQVKAGRNIKAIADYCGTSLQMIEADYCARLDFDSAKSAHEQIESQISQVLKGASPTGFESVGRSYDKLPKLLKTKVYEFTKSRKLG